MTTRVVSVVVTPNVHKARITTQDKTFVEGEWKGDWHEVQSQDVPIGQTVVREDYITDSRRIVIEEVPVKQE